MKQLSSHLSENDETQQNMFKDIFQRTLDHFNQYKTDFEQDL